ncbi:hypothetical protein KP509_1Z026300 [Ceratopteris richardii]|nr:hypothetical protein KP509_1Z026300 [Ceratopteris richardii]
MVTCIYRTKLADEYRVISVTWCKGLMGNGLSVSLDHLSPQLTCYVDMKPWLFWKKQGSKALDLNGKRIDVIWDFSSAKFYGSPEPQACFFLAISCKQEVLLLLGDMRQEALRRLQKKSVLIESIQLSRKEHMFGNRVYTTRAQFLENGGTHDIMIECQIGHERESRLSVKVDKQLVVQVKRLMWKFRGNQTIIIDGIPIQVLWDVHDWLFSSCDGHAVFMFQTCAANKRPWLQASGNLSSTLMQGHGSHSFKHTENYSLPEDLCSSVLEWPTSTSFKGKELCLNSSGFTLLLYAWRNP